MTANPTVTRTLTTAFRIESSSSSTTITARMSDRKHLLLRLFDKFAYWTLVPCKQRGCIASSRISDRLELPL